MNNRTWTHFGLYENGGETWFKSPADPLKVIGYFRGVRSDGERFWKSIQLDADSWERRGELIKQAEEVVATFLNCACTPRLNDHVCEQHIDLFKSHW